MKILEISTVLYKALLTRLITSVIVGFVSVSAFANNVNELAQGCYAIQSPGTGKYLDQKKILLETHYDFLTSSLDDAAHFYFKPVEFGKFLLTDRNGEFLGSIIPELEITLDHPAIKTEWSVSSKNNHFSFKNQFTHTKIRHNYKIKKGFWIFTWYEHKTETSFNLVAQNDCQKFPEMSIAAWPKGLPQHAENHTKMAVNLKGDINLPVRGYIDSHSHMVSYEFLGGKALPGDPFHRYGVKHALDDCSAEHGHNGILDIIGGGAQAHDTAGWPLFTDWPRHNSKGHSSYYYKWIERAHLSGLRMIVVYLVENQVLCTVQNIVQLVNPLGGFSNSCDTMDSMFLQIQRVHEMVNYVDAQYGGPGKGFMKVVTSPEHAREAIADGKLAVVLGVEASEILNCGELDYCDERKIDRELDDLYNAGVRVMYPVHKFDNHFAGASARNVADDLVHLGQKLSTGHFLETENCDEHIHKYDNEHVRSYILNVGIPILPEALSFLTGDKPPEYPQDKEQCNRKGLTDLGAHLVNRMIDKKMIIDLDHASPSAAATIMDIVDARGYGGVVSTHGWMLRAKDGPDDTNRSDDPLHITFKRLVDAGGFIAPLTSDSDRLINETEEYLLAHMKSLFPEYSVKERLEMLANLDPTEIPGVGLGVDMGGLANMAGPKGKNPGYPFENEFGIEFDRQGDEGGKYFDLANDGVAHYGMLADHIAQVRKDSSEKNKSYVYNSLMNSAESYLQMWQLANQRPDSDHFTP